MKTRKKQTPKLTLQDVTVLRGVCLGRVEELRTARRRCLGETFPRLCDEKIQEIAALFLKLTGDTLEADAEGAGP
jgi:hypothetical protein